MPITTELVSTGYKALLGREPESDDVLQSHARGATSALDFLTSLIGSREFADKTATRAALRRVDEEYRRIGTKPVTADVALHVLQTLLGRTAGQWSSLGEQDPYWSVLTDERYRKSRMAPEDHKVFMESGRSNVALLKAFEAESDHRLPRGTCLELGCGVGRTTAWLAREFEHVIATDISPGNLALCRQNLEDLGLRNVDYVLIKDFDTYARLPDCDVLFSFIVFQHNTPPVQKYLLELLLRKVRPKGGALWQMQNTIPGYRFQVDEYLASREPTLEMHALPMAHVLSTLGSAGLSALNIAMDNWTGISGSHTFFAARR